MAEWPPADRLRDALEATEIDAIDQHAAWVNVHTMTSTEVRARGSYPGRRKSLAVAVAVAASMAAIAGVALAARGGDEERVVASEPDTTEVVPSTSEHGPADSESEIGPVPLPDDEPCSAIPWDRYAVGEFGSAWLTVPATGGVQTLSRGAVVLADQAIADILPIDAAADSLEADRFLIAASDHSSTLVRSAFELMCDSTSAVLVVSGGEHLDSDVLCAGPLPGNGWLALAFVETRLGPPDCGGVQPSMVIDQRPVEDPAVQTWVARHECREPSQRVDSVGNTITEWEVCASTLVHVQTVTPAWDTDIDGQSLLRYVRALESLPR